jgi:hypothetical protein
MRVGDLVIQNTSLYGERPLIGMVTRVYTPINGHWTSTGLIPDLNGQDRRYEYRVEWLPFGQAGISRCAPGVITVLTKDNSKYL